jgi:hypothetical protein
MTQSGQLQTPSSPDVLHREHDTAFAPHWSAFLEGNWMDFGGPSGTVVTPNLAACAGGCPWSVKATEAIVLVGVNYRFW